MRKFLTSTVAYLIANAVGLLVATLLLPDFRISITGFIVAVLIFTVVQAVSGPIIEKLSAKYVPQLRGGIALVVIFVGLLITSLFVAGMSIGGIANLLAATLLVWLGSLAAGIALEIGGFGAQDKTAP